MNHKEKLIEIINNVIRCDKCGIVPEWLAEDLIFYGVTVQEWISVKDRLPEHGDVVLCFMKFGKQRILQWDNVSNWWLGYGHGDDWQKADVTHWCYLPQPPKGE